MTQHRLPWFKFNTADWLEGTAWLTREEKGTYIDLLCRMYERDGALPDDDHIVAHLLFMELRVWRRLRASLITKGKIKVTGAGIVNDRAMAVMKERQSKSKKASDAARKRHDSQTSEPAAFGDHLTNDQRMMANHSLIVRETGGKKYKETNVPVSETHCDRSAIEKEIEIENKNIPPTPQGGVDWDQLQGIEDQLAPKPRRKRATAPKVGRYPNGYPKDFCAAFDAYPDDGRKNAAKALKRWQALSEDVRAEIPAAIDRYKRKLAGTDWKVKWFEGFLNLEYLEDYLADGGVPKATETSQDPYASLRELTTDEWCQRLTCHANGSWNFKELGPPPGRHDAIVPEEALQRVNISGCDYDDNGLRLTPERGGRSVHN